MRLLSNLALTISIGALGFAGGALGLGMLAPPTEHFTPPERAAAQASLQSEPDRLETIWPALFGTVIIPEPEPEPEALPEPDPEPEIAAEPEENTLYYLTGLVSDGSNSWAMVASNDKTRVVRVGDTLEGGELVRAIDARGVWIDWGEIRQVIPVQRKDLSALVRIERLPVPELASGETAAPELRWAVEDLSARYIEEALTEAGSLTGSIQIDGSTGLNVTTIQPGQLYDQIGLRKGDTILRINGKSVESQGLPAETPTDVLNSGSLDLEILRDGARQVIRVHVEQI